MGSGLGLAIVKAVADAHGGVLSLLDRPGGGLIVRLEFPRLAVSPMASAVHAAAASTPSPYAGLLFITVLATGLLSFVSPGSALAVEPVVYPAPAGERQVLLIDAATDRTLMEPLILDFQRLAPTVTVSYSDYSTRDLYERTASGQPGADLVISSASDLQVKLINDGFSQPYESTATLALPDWAKWRDEAFGFTVEPAVIVYNPDLVPETEVPRSRNDLIRLIRDNGARYNRRVATYDAKQTSMEELVGAMTGAISQEAA